MSTERANEVLTVQTKVSTMNGGRSGLIYTTTHPYHHQPATHSAASKMRAVYAVW